MTCGTNTLQVLLNITFTAHQAYLMTDAIARIFYRKLISKRHLLEWVTTQERSGTAADRKIFVRFMWSAVRYCGVYGDADRCC